MQSWGSFQLIDTSVPRILKPFLSLNQQAEWLGLETYEKRHGTSYSSGIDSFYNLDSPSISKMHQLWYASTCRCIFGKYTGSVREKRENLPKIMCSHLQWSRRVSWGERGQGNQHVHFSLWEWGWHHLSITCVNRAWTEALFERKLQQWLSVSKLKYIHTYDLQYILYVYISQQMESIYLCINFHSVAILNVCITAFKWHFPFTSWLIHQLHN